MRKLLLSLSTVAFLLASGSWSFAQNTTGLVVATCGTVTSAFKAGNPGPFTVDVNGVLCTASGGSGGGTSSTFGAAFPATGTAVGFSNGTNMVAGRATSAALADGFTPPTSSLLQAQTFPMLWNGASWDRAPGSTAGLFGIVRDAAGNARGANVNASNQLNVAGPVTVVSGGIASGALAAGSIASGAMVDLGSQADAVCATDTGTCSLIALQKKGNSNTSGSVPAGTAIIGKVGVDQTTPGTTNGVALVGVNAATMLAGNGVTGTGSPRVTIASDNTPFSVNPLSATTPVSTMNSASANSGLNSAMAAVFDDTSPTAITENNFGFLRMSANRNLYGTIRDAAGNERGANVNSLNQLGVTSAPTFAAAQLTRAALSFNSSGNNTIVTRSVGTIKVYGLLLSCASALTTMIPQDGTSTSFGALSNVSSLYIPIYAEPAYVTSGTNNFVINLSSGVQCGGTVYYIDS